MMRSLLLLMTACSGGAGPGDDPTLPIDTSTTTSQTTTSTTTTGTATGGTTTGGTTPTGTWACRDDVDPGLLTGAYPPGEHLAIDFSAWNRDGTERNKPDLVGQITVLWFYPAANTFG